MAAPSAKPDAAFFYHVLKPGRYLGGETGVIPDASQGSGRAVAWFYPGPYEAAMSDPGWRRGYFQLAGAEGICCLRAVDLARDLWDRLSADGRPPFTIDGHRSLREVDEIVFWVPDVEAAARIPSIIEKLGFGSDAPRIGVVVNGYWAPRFLAGRVDWLVPAFGGWLPETLLRHLADGSVRPDGSCDARDTDRYEAYWSESWTPPAFAPIDRERTACWISKVEIADDNVDVDIVGVDSSGSLRVRGRASVVADALDVLRSTGVDGIRFCGADIDQAELLAGVLADLERVHNMRRVRVSCPPTGAAAFDAHWGSYKPHLIKPLLRLRIDPGDDAEHLIAVGRRALNAGWEALTAVLYFSSYAELESVVATAQAVLPAWHRAGESFADKRPVRVEYRPAGVDRWLDPPIEPAENDVRRLASLFRRFKEEMARVASVGTFRIEDVMGRNWLAAADPEIWPDLAQLDLADTNDVDAEPQDWFVWIRHRLGIAGPPTRPFLRIPVPAVGSEPEIEAETSYAKESVGVPGDHMFGRRRKKAAFSRRLTAPARLRMRVRFAKGPPWRLYSHLDMVRAIERALRRSRVPTAYSEGFHPRMKISFGPPLPFGVISSSEYFDVILTEDYDTEFAERLGRALPDGLVLRDAQGLTANVPSLTETINEAVFRAILPISDEIARGRVQEFMAMPEIRFQRPDRPQRRPFDPRKNLRETSVAPTPEGTEWSLRVRLGGEGSIRPTDWAVLLFALTPEQLAEIVIERTDLLIRQSGRIRTPLEGP
ncbi:MAG TPA: TIGR03936 family radical SAM-associated protein [Acidobacteriota bacterium]|nr:TIGR03936 family radical SAM-associated protein [Acidobacteriota bacterium]